MPEVGAEVTVKVPELVVLQLQDWRLAEQNLLQITKVSPRLAAADILCVASRPVTTVFSGIIRFALTLSRQNSKHRAR